MKLKMSYFLPLDVFFYVTPLIFVSFDVFARAGGGGGGGHGGGGIVGALLLPFFFIYTAYVGFRINYKQRKVSAALAKMALTEPQWSESNLLSIASNKFMLLQAAWGRQDLDFIKKNLHPILFPSWETDLKSQIARNERNLMTGLSISKLRIVEVKNVQDDELDEFTVAIDASANDQIIKDGAIIKTNDSSFREFWTFEWEQGEWVLKEVVQANGWKRFVNAPIIYEQCKKIGA